MILHLAIALAVLKSIEFLRYLAKLLCNKRHVTDQLTTSLVRADTPECVKQGNVRLTPIVLVTGTCGRMAVAVSDLDFIVFVGFLGFRNRTHTLFSSFLPLALVFFYKGIQQQNNIIYYAYCYSPFFRSN